MGGPYTFGQYKKVPSCALTTAAGASASAMSAYNSWKNSYVTPAVATATNPPTPQRVRRPGNGDDTVSEGIGYGMLAAAYVGDRVTFDGLWAYAKSHFDAKGLMNWQIGSSGAVVSAGSATDGDEDMAWALLMASNQWSSATYLADAKAVIGAMYTNSIAGDGMLRPGDNWGASSPATFPDYFSPAYFRVFAAATNNPNWGGIILDRNYAILASVSGTNGLVPDEITNITTSQNSNTYGYDACRTPWRIGMDYCFNGETRAKTYLDKVGPFFTNIGAANIGDGYSLSGSQTSGNKSMAFIGPAGIAGMAGYQSLLDGAFNFGVANTSNDYFKDSLRVVTMFMMSGNFVDLTKP
jgi:endo-1,4-beta-D-glucanase Y